MLQSITVLRNTFATASLVPSTPSTNKTNANFANKSSIRFRFRVRAYLEQIRQNFSVDRAEIAGKKSDVVLNSLRVLEWDRLCGVVSSFARTSLGSEATKEQLWSLDQSYEESLELLRETNAAVEIYTYDNVILDLTGIDVLLVRSAIHNAQRGLPVTAKEAFSVSAVLQFADTLQTSIKAAIRENADMHSRFMPLAEMILHWVVNGTLTHMIRQIIDEDGSVKDSASPTLRQARQRVQELERRLYQLLSSLVGELSSSMEISNIDGRWCIRSAENQPTIVDGLLLSSGSGVGSIVEPLSAVPLNDELQQAKTLVIDAEIEVLMQLTSKMQMDLDNIWNILKDVIFLDVVNARASFGLLFGGTCPELLPPEYNVDASPEGNPSESNASGHSSITKKEWNLCLPKAYHPLLLEQHRQNLKKAKTDVAHAKSENRRRRLYEGTVSWKEGKEDLPMLESKVAEIEDACPVPVDFFIEKKTRILLITGPNTGGKTICLKTAGLAAMMAKSGLYILCAEPARIPWVDSVFADIGDEQSLSQSLSTFSGHLKQISDIQAKSSSQSLVLLDEIGAGTNPLEGAALGMSILESFAEAGALLTIATTHHGELKTLKYSNDAFENACMEFDEANLRPTYKILWGIPGRSNAINIAERLGLLQSIIGDARELYGTASNEIDEVIFDMEQYKQNVQRYVQEAKHYLMLSKDLHEKLLISQSKLLQHTSNLRSRKMRQVSELASAARSLLHKKMQQHRATARRISSQTLGAGNCSEEDASNQEPVMDDQQKGTEFKGTSVASRNRFPAEDIENTFSEPTTSSPPKVGDLVFVQSLGMKATLLEAEPSKNLVLVQVGNLKMKLKITDLKSC